MPRRARILLPSVPVHLIQRGNNRSVCFYADEDYRFYLDHLTEQAAKHGCAVHAYCLMTNHVHLLVTPQRESSLGGMMKGLGQCYVQYINRTYRRSGTLWEGRFRSCLLQEEAYVLACYRYIELNPVRAGIVNHPAEYRWTSYCANAQGEPTPWLTAQSLYLSLGEDDESRLAAYRELFRHELEPGVVDQIRQATNGNFALGDERFATEVERMLGRRVTRAKPGRPCKVPAPVSEELFA
ncbi:transposase [Denitratisoma oestradiolicum]|uniref:Transposase n=1 Tax=Denitratisoma oestradiolicum TaxID=311182 RepID=A0A6S6XMZ2_9PROT|nr:transposase [Denitratisoma oestradiolicum]TWO80955.1 transposase [Denitratisoma oestradiolicum]CAB1367271.1 transposase [Denitratisoma oestradiolicum]